MSNAHLEPEKESSMQIDLLAWYEVNKRNVFAGIGLMVVVIGATMIYRHMQESKVRDASSALLEVVQPGRSEEAKLDVSKLLAVAQQHSGAPAAVHATLLAGRELFVAGKFAEARAQFEKAAGERNVLGAIALYGVATCVDAEKGGAEALAAYQSVISHPAASLVAGQARIGKARVHESLNQHREALALYDELAKDKDRDVAGDALRQRAALLKAHPELDKPAAPAAATLTNALKVGPAPAPAPAPAKTGQ